MDDSADLPEKTPEQQLQEIEELVFKWKDATDAESRWAISLLTDMAEQIRSELGLRSAKSTNGA
jgi:hypothetical protein